MPGHLIYRLAMLARAWSLLLLLVASSLLVTTTAHAREAPGSAPIACSGTTYAESDGDPSPTDPDTPFAHHHGTCHVHPIGLPASIGWGLVVFATRLAPIAARDAVCACGSVDPALRPPAA